MKSIRRSLVSNLFILLVVTLAVVIGVAYRTTSESIREKQQTARALIELQYREKCDEALLAQAHQLARETQSQFNVNRLRNQILGTQLQMLTSSTGPYGFLPISVQVLETVGNPMSWWLHARLATEIKLNEDELYRETDSPKHEYVQLNSDWGATWLSKSLDGHSLPTEHTSNSSDDLYQSRFDTIELKDGKKVRRVIVKVPVTRFGRIGNFSPPSRPRFDDQPSGRPRFDETRISRGLTGVASHARALNRPNSNTMFGPPPGPPPSLPEPRNVNLPTIDVHVAWDLSDPHPTILGYQENRNFQWEEIDRETQTTLLRLQRQLGWISGIALCIALLGGWILVGFGLNPLKKLSHAVSEISTKDFRVPIDPKTLPTEVTPLVDRLSLALTELQRAFEREKRAAADISHELRTPLAAMTTTLDVACRKTRTAEQYRDTINDCRAIAKQMNSLVERMLALAWLDTGSDTIHPELVEVAELLDGCVTIGKPLAEVQGVTVNVNRPDHLVVNTDPAKLREVVMNLVHNAIEYNQPGGRIDVSAQPSVDGGLTVEVSDTGIGMSPEVQEKIFERFFRADPSRHATGVHAGLGLAIVKEYVERLGGRLHVESVVGQGSKFRVELPNAS